MRRRAEFLAVVILASAGLLCVFYWERGNREGEEFPAAQAFREAAPALARELAGQRIFHTSIAVDAHPEQGRLAATAIVEATRQGDSRTDFCFLLNAGLRAGEARVNGEPAHVTQRGRLLTVQPKTRVDPEARAQIEVRYEGGVSPEPLSWNRLDDTGIALHYLSCWYPCDLTSFAPYRCSVTLPEDWTLAIPGPFESIPAGERRHTLTWESSRPVLGISLAGGRLQRATHESGDMRNSVCWPAGVLLDPQPYLEALATSRTLGALRYGSDGFPGFVLVLLPGIRGGMHGGNGIAFLPLSDEKSDGAFADAAALVAQNWWGATVTGRWVTNRPEGAAWILHGMARYTAFDAYAARFGPRACQRYLETHVKLLAPAFPLRSVVLADQLGGDPAPEPLFDVQPFMAMRMLAQTMGESSFLEAGRRFLAVHRYAPVSTAAFRQECELASGQDLSGFFSTWVNKTPSFDLSLGTVEQVEGGIRVGIENASGAALPNGLEVALVSASGTEMRVSRGDAQGGTYVFDTGERVSRVVLDPLFSTPDIARANNVWPRQCWPAGVGGGPAGWIALVGKHEWYADKPTQIAVVREGEPVQWHARVDEGIAVGPLWSPDGGAVAIEGQEVRCRSERNGLVTCAAGRKASLAGWWDKERLVCSVESPARAWLVCGTDGRPTADGPCMELPRPGTLRRSPGKDIAVYIARDSGALRLVSLDGLSDYPFCSAARCVGTPGWSPDGRDVIFMEEDGRLYRIPLTGARGAPAAVFGHAVSSAAVSPGGEYVAWIAGSGRLWTAETATLSARFVEITGEVMDFTWSGPDTLACLTAQPDPAIGSHFMATYAVWLVDCPTLTTRRVSVDPARPTQR